MDSDARQPAEGAPAHAGAPQDAPAGRADRQHFIVMAALVAADLALGLVAIVTVPFSRPSAWVPAGGRAVYLVHALLGAALAAGSLWLVARTRAEDRVRRGAASIGLAGIALGGAGGIVAVYHPVRLLGMALMFLGSVIAAMAYLAPSLSSPASAGSP